MCINIFFFFNDTATTEIYTLSLHDALPISRADAMARICPAGAALFRDDAPNNNSNRRQTRRRSSACERRDGCIPLAPRSEEHTSELQSRQYLVCRLLLEKKKNKNIK